MRVVAEAKAEAKIKVKVKERYKKQEIAQIRNQSIFKVMHFFMLKIVSF